MLRRSIRVILAGLAILGILTGTARTAHAARFSQSITSGPGASLQANGGEEYSLTARHSGKCLDVSGFSQADGADVFQWRCLGGWNQTWKLYFVGGGDAMLVAKHSGKCLDVANGSLLRGADVYVFSSG
jgi:hypothetical protein